MINNQLYKRFFGGPFLKCLSNLDAQYVLAKLHEGVCDNHLGRRTLAHQAYSQGYYWTTMKQDAKNYVCRCDQCQKHAPIPRLPSDCLNPVASPWSFTQWGMDIVGSLPTNVAKKKLLLVATNYFNKWVEVEAYASIKDKDITKFVWKNIICRFRIPHAIVTNNGLQFDSSIFREFCLEIKIKNVYSTPRYP